jgi:hypothetical protein
VDVGKGAMRRLAPIDMEHQQVYDAQAKHLAGWMDPGNKPDKAVRESVDRLEGPARIRALHKLHGLTEVRVNPETKMREFLLHRGMTQSELNHHLKNKIDTKTSWTLHLDMASKFAGDKGKVASAWVPESHIHHVPIAVGAHDAQYVPFSNSIKDEHEVFVNPHSLNLNKAAFADSRPQIKNTDHGVLKTTPLSRATVHEWRSNSQPNFATRVVQDHDGNIQFAKQKGDHEPDGSWTDIPWASKGHFEHPDALEGDWHVDHPYIGEKIEDYKTKRALNMEPKTPEAERIINFHNDASPHIQKLNDHANGDASLPLEQFNQHKSAITKMAQEHNLPVPNRYKNQAHDHVSPNHVIVSGDKT